MITWLFSSISDMMYSLFQKYNALSATWTPYKVNIILLDWEFDLCIHLKVWTGDTLGNLLEQWFLDFDELRRLDHIQNLLDLTQEHHLVRKIRIHTVNQYLFCKHNYTDKFKYKQKQLMLTSTSFCEHVLGQNFSSPLITLELNVQSTNST